MKIDQITKSQSMIAREPIYYFSYGMLCDPKLMIDNFDAKLIGKAILPGYRFEILQHANVLLSPSRVVNGCLWEIDSDILQELDRIEEYPNYYTRVIKPVISRGKTYNAQVYVMTTDYRINTKSSIPTQQYVDQIARGYRHAKIPLKQLVDAVKIINSKIESQRN